jgi:hypothetical protein
MPYSSAALMPGRILIPTSALRSLASSADAEIESERPEADHDGVPARIKLHWDH